LSGAGQGRRQSLRPAARSARQIREGRRRAIRATQPRKPVRAESPGERLTLNEKLAPNEVNLAMKLIEGMTVEFDPAKYHDTYSEDFKKLIDAKAKGSEAP